MNTDERDELAHLFIRTGPNSGEMHQLGREPATVGRGLECEIRLQDLSASRKHFQVERRGAEFWVIDLKSRNHTYVNGLPVNRKELQWGDEICAGESRFLFLTGSQPEEITQETRAASMTRKLDTDASRGEMVGSSPAMRRVFSVIEKVAPVDVTVLIAGESGTGKELVARAIHRNSLRCNGQLIAVNCAAIPSDLAESELFGHERGAFTGAGTLRRGRFEQADCGTLFLDEVGELSRECQAKLLRVLEERRVMRLGGENFIDVDVRLVAASNRDLREMVAEGSFREDLLYRLEVVHIELPPLRERPGDIPDLARFFLRRYREKLGRTVRELSPGALKKLAGYDWPGNVRELKNVVERAMILAGSSVIDEQALSFLDNGGNREGRAAEAPATYSEQNFPPLSEVVRGHVEKALDLTGGNKKRAAGLLGIPRSSLYDRLREYDLI